MAETEAGAADWDFQDVRDTDARYDSYKVLRRRCPVPLSFDGNTGAPVRSVMRYRDAQDVLRDPATFANSKRTRMHIRRPPLESDPPEHPQIRRALQPFWTPPAVKAFEPTSRRLVRELLDPLIAAGEGDLAAGFSRPLPAQVLLTFMGQPAEDWAYIKRHSDDVRPIIFTSQAQRDLYANADAEMWDYSRRMVEDREANPRDPKTDIVACLLSTEIDGAPMDRDLVLGTVRLIIAAGHDSTTQALNICIHHLATRPDHQDHLRRNPEAIRAAIEEILRYRSPVTTMPRHVNTDVEIAGTAIAAGSILHVCFASANHDPEIFDRPDECILDRKPNPHMVFGQGIHGCLGAPLARQEMLVGLSSLLQRTKGFGLSGEPGRMKGHHLGYDALPMWIEPA
ncbi:cytochrome P450 [Rhodobacterales bacterium HKCCE2091]|nr:cytochrome P450 [Rhodobacterales bacterium HKCCE2091]